MPAPQRMTPSEAFVETLVAQGVTDVFGIVGSAYMDALDLFPAAGIRFISVAHEQGAAHMADGYARASGRHGVCIAQNGPGITNFVTAIAAAYWAHSPVVAHHARDGQPDDGARRLPGDRADADLLEDHQVPGAREQPEAHGRARRRARSTARCSRSARCRSTSRATTSTARSTTISRRRCASSAPPGGARRSTPPAALLAKAKFPVIVAGGGVIMSSGTEEARRSRSTSRAGRELRTCTTIPSRRATRSRAARSATRARRPR